MLTDQEEIEYLNTELLFVGMDIQRAEEELQKVRNKGHMENSFEVWCAIEDIKNLKLYELDIYARVNVLFNK